jgi:hypothetical protein
VTGYSYAMGYFERGWSPLPLPHGMKKSPPEGTTGAGAPLVFAPQIREWIERDENANIALRLPKNVIGIDVDAYKPNARATMERLTLLAPMPPTWRSSARPVIGDGGFESGIYFFRIPDSVDSASLRDPRGPEGKKDSDVEVIRHEHRYAVVSPSLHPEGGHYRWYAPDGSSSAPAIGDLPLLPSEWLPELLPTAVPPAAVTARAPITEQGIRSATSYERAAVMGSLQRLVDMKKAATADPSAYRGEPWDQTTFDVACRLFEIANAEWSTITPEDVEQNILGYAPRDDGFDDARVLEKIRSAQRKVGSSAAAPPTGTSRVDDSGLFRGAPTASADVDRRVIPHDSQVDVSNSAKAAQWLFDEVGTGRLSGVFYRKGELVYTPRIGEEGYVEPRNAVAEGAASITVMTDRDLRARIQRRYEVVKTVVDKVATKRAKEIDPHSEEILTRKPAMFPLDVAGVAVHAADDAPNLRTLEGVVHAPTFRRDGSLISRPGYDAQSSLLFLPTGGQPDVLPDEPSMSDVEMAVKRISYMLQDFDFVTDHDRASYIGLMLSPLLRNLAAPPYKLGVIEAHQPGSGKTFLARALTTIHGGVLHAELPHEEAELVKTISAILDTQTSPIVAFDNVTGLVKSSTLTGLLTSPTFQGRRLGTGTVIEANNDRLWIITGNNAVLGGDLGRRHVRVRIDPGVPNPEKRTNFTIENFEKWVHEHRGEILWSLLVLARNWVCRGMPFPSAPTADSYGLWAETIRGILTTAGFPGVFDAPETREEADPETEEWTRFAELVHGYLGDRPWTTRDLLGLVSHPAVPTSQSDKPIPFEALPAALYSGKQHVDPLSLTTTLGYFLRYRRGRWFGNYSFQYSGEKTRSGRLFRVAAQPTS